MSDDKDFVIKDRRVFSQEESETEKGAADEPVQGETSTEAPQAAGADAPEPDADDAEAQSPLPEITFSTFIMSLNASALVSLGLIDDPASGQRVKNLPLSKQTIDILGMLEEKTSGNLSEDEAQMLKSILYELRMQYVKEKE